MICFGKRLFLLEKGEMFLTPGGCLPPFVTANRRSQRPVGTSFLPSCFAVLLVMRALNTRVLGREIPFTPLSTSEANGAAPGGTRHVVDDDEEAPGLGADRHMELASLAHHK